MDEVATRAAAQEAEDSILPSDPEEPVVGIERGRSRKAGPLANITGMLIKVRAVSRSVSFPWRGDLVDRRRVPDVGARCASASSRPTRRPGPTDAGVADYIDGCLGAFRFDPPRIWAGGPSSGRFGGRGRVRRVPPLTALDELAWRTRIEGSLGHRPSASSTARWSGSRSATATGLAALGRRLRRLRARASRTRACGPRADFTALALRPRLRGHVRGTRVRRQPGRRRMVDHRLRRRRPAPGLDRRRGLRAMTVDAIIIGSGPGGSTAADVLTAAGWSRGHLREGP